MTDLLRLITLQDPNTRVVLLGASLLGLSAGVIGTFAVLRRRALVGDALAHAALPGIGAAYFVVGERNFAALLLGALVFGLLGVACIALVRAHTRIKEDAAIGIVLSSFFGLGIVFSRLIQNQAAGNRAGLDGFLFGKAASMVRSDVLTIAGMCAVVLVCVAGLYKELKLLCFDREFAAAMSRPVVVLDLVLLALVCLCVVAGLPAVGVVLTAALLIIPAAAARFWTDRLGITVALAGVIGAASGLVGTALSATLPSPTGGLTRGWPAGALVVLVAGVIFLFSMQAAPRSGVVAEWIRRISLRRRTALQNVLRAAYELGELRRGFGEPWTLGELRGVRMMEIGAATSAIHRARRGGLVRTAASGAGEGAFALTERGVDEASRLTRTHRLWEQFLIEQADIAVDHVDRDADEIEHVLPPEVVRRLEDRLARDGRLPPAVPESPHPLAPGVRGGGA